MENNQVSFETALFALKRGALIRRYGWPVQLHYSELTSTILVSTLGQDSINWQPTQRDILAKDWLIEGEN